MRDGRVCVLPVRTSTVASTVHADELPSYVYVSYRLSSIEGRRSNNRTIDEEQKATKQVTVVSIYLSISRSLDLSHGALRSVNIIGHTSAIPCPWPLEDRARYYLIGTCIFYKKL